MRSAMSSNSSSCSNRALVGPSGTPIARASSPSHPIPTPNQVRPRVNASSVAIAFTWTAGGRNGTGDTSIPSRARLVIAARNPSMLTASNSSACG